MERTRHLWYKEFFSEIVYVLESLFVLGLILKDITALHILTPEDTSHDPTPSVLVEDGVGSGGETESRKGAQMLLLFPTLLLPTLLADEPSSHRRQGGEYGWRTYSLSIRL
jgi:hypothetical protein